MDLCVDLWKQNKKPKAMTKTNKMKQVVLNVTFKHNNTIFSKQFILFEGDILENLLPIDSKTIQVDVISIN